MSKKITGRSLSIIIFVTIALFSLSAFDRAMCSEKSSLPARKSAIAVLRFENKSAFDRLDPFEVALPYMLISDLSKISSIQLVEREKIDKLLAEINVAEKDLMDAVTLQKAGKALGADFVISGNFKEEVESGTVVGEIGESKLNIDIIVKDIATGTVLKKIKVHGKTKDFFKIEKEIIQRLIDILYMNLNEQTKEEVDKIITQSLEAVLHFGRGEKARIMSGYYGIQDTRRGAFSGGISEKEAEKFLLQAVSEFKQALYLDTKYADAQYAIAITFSELARSGSHGRKKEKMDKYLSNAIAEAEKFVSIFPDDPRCVERLDRLANLYWYAAHWGYLYTNDTNHKKTAEYLDKAIQCYRKRIFEYGHIQQGLLNSIEQMAGIFQKKRDYIKAIETYEYLIKHYSEEKASGLYPIKIRCRYAIFDCYNAMKDYDKALETLDYIIINRLFARPYLNNFHNKKYIHKDDMLVLKKIKGNIYFKMGNYQKAAEEWLNIEKKVSELCDNGIGCILACNSFSTIDFWFDLAEVHRKLGEDDRVIYILEKAVYYYSLEYNGSKCSLKFGGNRLISIYLELGQFYEQQGNYKKALSLYEFAREHVFPDPLFGKRIFICRQKLEVDKRDSLVEWVSLSPLRERSKRFEVNRSVKGSGFIPTSITTWKHSVWIPVATCSFEKDSKGNFKFDVHNKHPHWYLYSINLNSMTEKIIEVPDDFKIGYNLQDVGEITDIAIDSKEIWLSCNKRGVLCYNRLLKEWKHFTTDNGLVFNTSLCFAISGETIWCGLGEQGRGAVMAYDREKKQWVVYHHPVATASAVTALALDGNNLWVGNEKGTISVFNTKDSSWKIIHQDKQGYTFPVEDIFVSKNEVWFACNFNGIRKYDKTADKWQVWKWQDPDMDESLRLKCVIIDGNDIWAGGNGGVYKLDDSLAQFVKVDSGRFFKLYGVTSIAAANNSVWFIRPGYLQTIIVHFKDGVKENTLIINKK